MKTMKRRARKFISRKFSWSWERRQNAGQLARTLVTWCAGKHDADNEVFARDVLVRSLLAQSTKNDEAESEAKALQAVLPKATDEEILLSARITIAQATGMQQTFPRAFADLSRYCHPRRINAPFVMQELSANLALAESRKRCTAPTWIPLRCKPWPKRQGQKATCS